MEDEVKGGSIALSPAAVGGRRGRSSKKLKLVKKKTVKRMLKKMGMKMRGGATAVVAPAPEANAMKALAATGTAVTGGRHRKSRRAGKSHRRSRKYLGLF
jgi:hypothetical protein